MAKRWTKEETAKLIRVWQGAANVWEVSEVMDRTCCACIGRAQRLKSRGVKLKSLGWSQNAEPTEKLDEYIDEMRQLAREKDEDT